MRKESRGMAFRHLYAINLTMLGKQGWRLMTNHDIIVTKVFKAKYFPSGNFLDAQLGNNLSFVWRSIHALQVMVNQGLRWRLGNGNSVNICNQPWMIDNANSSIMPSSFSGPNYLTVGDHKNGKGISLMRFLAKRKQLQFNKCLYIMFWRMTNRFGGIVIMVFIL